MRARHAAFLLPWLLIPLPVAAVAPCRAEDPVEPFAVIRERFDAAARDGEAAECTALGLLTAGGHADGVAAVAAALRGRPTAGMFAHAALAMGSRGTPATLDALRRVATSGGPTERAAVALALRTHDAPAARNVLAGLLLDSAPAVRAAAVVALGHVDRGPAIRAALVEALDDPAWAVRVAAVRAAGRRSAREAARALVAMLGTESGRLRAAAVDALRGISGLDLGDDAGPWERWIETGEAPPRGDIQYHAPTWYGLPVVGERPVFVLDASGSMERAIHVSDADRRRLSARGEFATKLDLARAELLAVLQRLPRTTRFGLVVYADTAKAWKPALVAASPEHVRSAAGVLGRADVGGLTNIYDALLLAMEPAKGRDLLERGADAPDQILFLTDGVPSTGTFRDADSIRRVVTAVAEVRGVRIDCVAIATGQTAFLEDLARATGGACVSVGR